jgi:hypothetical protein
MAATTAAQTVEGGQNARPRYRRWRWRVAAASVVVLVGTGFGLWRWQHGLTLLAVGGNEIGGPIPIGRTVYALALDYTAQRAPLTVDLQTVTPVIVRNTAVATVDVLQCRDEHVPTTYVLHVRWCHQLRPFTSGNHEFSGSTLGGDALILAVTAYQPGVVHIAGMNITYKAGLRQGEQNTGLRMDFRAIVNWHY